MMTNQNKPKPPEYTPEELKRMRGIHIAETGGVQFVGIGKWRVKGHDKDHYYVTKIGKGLLVCTCPDFDFRGFKGEHTTENNEDHVDEIEKSMPEDTEFVPCKHIIAVDHYNNRSLT